MELANLDSLQPDPPPQKKGEIECPTCHRPITAEEVTQDGRPHCQACGRIVGRYIDDWMKRETIRAVNPFTGRKIGP